MTESNSIRGRPTDMPVRELFHLMAIVDDFDAASAFYDALFSPLPIMEKSWSDFDKRWASIGMIGPDLPFELMEPSKQADDAGAPLVKFQARFGEHLHSLSWFVDGDDFEDHVRRMQTCAIRVVGPDGSPVGDEVPQVVFTHGRDTLGQLEFMPVDESPLAERYPNISGQWGDRSPAWWRDEHPLGIVRTSHVTVAARDVDHGLTVFGDALGGTVLHRDDRHAFVLVGSNTVVEVATTGDESSDLGRDLAANGELPHQCTLLVRDLDAAERHATAVGAAVLGRTGDTVVLDPRTTFGSRFAFTTAPVPNDPRR
jgi:hypothetical protein